MQSIILVMHVLIAICLIAMMLLQHGKGTNAGATFGSGASDTMFGSAGATPFLMKVTIFLAAAFFSSSIGLSYMASNHADTITSPLLTRAVAPPIPRVLAKFTVSRPHSRPK